MKRNYLRIINYILLLLGIIILILFVRTINVRLVAESLKSAGFKVIAIVFVLMLLNVIVKAYRWKYLIKKITKKDVSLLFSFFSIFAGVASGSIFPGRNEITKPLMLSTKYKTNLSNTIAASLIEKMLDLISIVILFFAAIIFIREGQEQFINYIVPFSLIGIIILSFMFIFPKRLSSIIQIILKNLPIPKKLKLRIDNLRKTFFDSFQVLRQKKSSFIFLFLSILAAVLEVLRIYYLFSALNMFLSVPVITFAFSASLLIGVITLIPGGVGITEFSAATIIWTLSKNLDLTRIKTTVFIDRIVAYYFIVVFGAVVLVFYQRLIKHKEA